ncbi:prolyl oligopeptidase family serine peptidase [Leifsonia sp. C5G2]|uniref:alpha/beta hydrolase family protein n=1 Tax=Leifsonia sp. C5G2 TaxID=2735269 RepID=UPI0015849E0C|nr:prolyl oligopeptidase family serine peptidase [Leifsonia sp. C5G2]NUU07939.1 prolyl oligopeptidase family serine peptidase [Leifsonia sp. C5G2]
MAHTHEFRFSGNDDFDFEIRTTIGQAFSGAADIGEVLAAVQGVGDNDYDGWFRAWLGLGDRIAAQADASARAGHSVSAASAYLRAASYYATAVNAVASLASEDELLPTFRKHRAAWDAWVDAVDLDIASVAIPYQDTMLPGYLFRSPGVAAEAASRPLLVVVNGSDGALTSLWSSAVSGALRRGYDALVFDGPGQQSMLFERGVPFRPDWEAVLTPVLDFALAQPRVDADRVALYGISQAGYWVPRALAFEHRFAAAVADPGVVDVSTSWTDHLPGNMRKLLDEGDDAKFDRDMELGMKFSHELANTWRFRARPYGTTGYAETLRAVLQYSVEQVAGRITTPLLITDPEHEQFWPGQSERLAALTPSVSTLVRFTEAEGADFHVQPLARALTEQRMFDWLDERLGR